ncbi:MAG: PmeII family type II restriction endonuclease [Bacteroidales bacterium]|nr:PmeII family type II restriction endonuclease [Bacteroidales bacterium]HNW74152.1 PmeII family type II restriction endonuclease [Bacteroidales bacterium]HPS51222.1 PmeII family type II restriction endonuclease [Bacteroidales bacterium]
MKELNLTNVTKYVEENIGEFHEKRLAIANKINLKQVIRSKNPYLFKAKNVTSASQIVEGILNAYLSSSEEGLFGNWLEKLAIFINDSVYQGRKAGIEGIDLDFDKEGNRYLISIKSGPNWGNDSQIKKMIDQFDIARRRLHTSGGSSSIICVNGCCYGKSREQSEYKSKGNYYKTCGKRFWELISGEPDLYLKLIQPLGHKATEKNNEFKIAYENLKNRMTKEFLIVFCKDDGSIDWDKLLIFNSCYIQK